jgi:hypothetical protein
MKTGRKIVVQQKCFLSLDDLNVCDEAIQRENAFVSSKTKLLAQRAMLGMVEGSEVGSKTEPENGLGRSK